MEFREYHRPKDEIQLTTSDVIIWTLIMIALSILYVLSVIAEG